MLKDLLEQKKCFKLVCGAGNEDADEVEKLVALYSAAGCRFFDLAANKDIIEAAQRGLDYSIPKENQKDYFFCASVGIKGEPHLNKAKINLEKCVGCGECQKVCLQKAIENHALASNQNNNYESRLGLRIASRGRNFLHGCKMLQTRLLRATKQPIQHQMVCTDLKPNPSKIFGIREEKCVGCLKCLKACNQGAIEVYQKNKQIEEILRPILCHCEERSDAAIQNKINCIELHASGTDEEDVEERWNFIQDNFDGLLSICIDRSKLGNEAILNRIKKLIRDRKPYSTIIQADGAPMSGGEDNFKTTLQAVAMAEVIQDANLPVYMLLSGGTNTKTAELAKTCGIEANGVSVGSYARKIVKKHIEREDFLQNKTAFCQALEIAEKLISDCNI